MNGSYQRTFSSTSLGDDDLILSQGDNPSPWKRRRQSSKQEVDFSLPATPIQRGKTIHDRIHDHITLPPLLVAVIDTPEFQRLRKLKQLGCTDLLFPSAVHSRFEHSIGVAHLAGKMVQHLRQSQPELGIDERDVLCLQFAGLVHDLGHGPFSHSFETFVNRLRKAEANTKGLEVWEHWHHEDNSVLLLDALVSNNNIALEAYGLHPQHDLRFVKLLIKGLDEGKAWPEDIGRSPEKRFLFDIVANKRSGIDVDKLDYFLRDATTCYGSAGIDCQIERIVGCSRVLKPDGRPQICFQEKIALSLTDIFLLRAKMHKYVYQHHTVKAADEMMHDIFNAAEGRLWLTGADGRRLTLSQSVKDPVAYTKTGDWILDYIEASSDPCLEEARAILALLRRRRLYPMVSYASLRDSPRCLPMTEENIHAGICRCMVEEEDAKPADLVVCIVKISFGSCDSNGVADDPIDHVYFFNPKVDSSQTFKLPRSRVSSLFRPTCFEERTVFLFSRRPEAVKGLRSAFDRWEKLVEDHLDDDPVPFNFSPRCSWSTPSSTTGKKSNSNGSCTPGSGLAPLRGRQLFAEGEVAEPHSPLLL